MYFLSDILSICCIKLKAYTFIQFAMMNGGSVFQPVDVIITSLSAEHFLSSQHASFIIFDEDYCCKNLLLFRIQRRKLHSMDPSWYIIDRANNFFYVCENTIIEIREKKRFCFFHELTIYYFFVIIQYEIM